MPESARAWRLSVVLHELHGADLQTRSELQNLPEVIYHDIDEVVTAVPPHRLRQPSAADGGIDRSSWRQRCVDRRLRRGVRNRLHEPIIGRLDLRFVFELAR
jgi:hypothetical protein